MNWIQLTCEGLAPLFEKRPCDNYSKPPPQCSLLQQRAIARLCETGRCVFAMIGFVQEKLAKRFHHLDAREDIDLEQLLDRLKRVVWKGTRHPAGWLEYLGTTFQRATVRALARQRLMPEERNCGTCVHLPSSNPRVCRVSGDIRKGEDRACDDYRFLPTTITAGSGNGSRDLGEDGETKFFPTAIERSEEAQQRVEARMVVESLRRELAKRVERERQGTRRRAIATRQYELFLNLHRLGGEVVSDDEAFRIVCKQMGVSPKMVRRDLAEIRDFLSHHFQ